MCASDMPSILQTATAILTQRSSLGALPLSEMKHEERFVKLAQRINISLRPIVPKRDERLALLSRLFDRPIASTYDLSIGQAQAFIGVWAVASSQFQAYLIQLKEEHEPE